jgi:hypothetical protein
MKKLVDFTSTRCHHISYSNGRRPIMGLFDNGLKGNIISGLAIGIGAAILGPVVIPACANALKPITKAAIKSSILLFEKGKETFAEVSEVVEDMVAEVKAEMAEAHAEPVSTVEAAGGTSDQPS